MCNVISQKMLNCGKYITVKNLQWILNVVSSDIKKKNKN